MRQYLESPQNVVNVVIITVVSADLYALVVSHARLRLCPLGKMKQVYMA